MNLLHPTLGDLIDRAVIVELKQREHPQFFDEGAELQTEIVGRLRETGPIPRLNPLTEDLRRIHSKIWNINVQLANLDKRREPPPNDLGLTAWRLNQARIHVLEQIAVLSGEHTRPVKVY